MVKFFRRYVEKTNFLLISNFGNSIASVSITLGGHGLDSASSIKFLGMVLDDKLKYDQHINLICSKISKSIGVLYRIRSFVPKSCLKNLYHSIIHPYYVYCLPIFGSTYDTHLEPLRILQKRAIRIINGSGYLDHTAPLFYASKILKLEDLYKHSVACYMYDHQSLLLDHVPSHSYGTRNRDRPVPPRQNLRSTEQSVIYNGIRIWNVIPNNIKTCLTKQSFKYQFKKYLLSQYLLWIYVH